MSESVGTSTSRHFLPWPTFGPEKWPKCPVTTHLRTFAVVPKLLFGQFFLPIWQSIWETDMKLRNFLLLSLAVAFGFAIAGAMFQFPKSTRSMQLEVSGVTENSSAD